MFLLFHNQSFFSESAKPENDVLLIFQTLKQQLDALGHVIFYDIYIYIFLLAFVARLILNLSIF